MREIDWTRDRAHRGQVIADRGQWLGVTDEDGVPLVELPPVSDMSWPRTRGVIESVSLKLRARTESGRPHTVVDELIAHGLGTVDEVGRLEPLSGPARLLVLERDGMRRAFARVTHAVADGDAHSPHTLTIHAVGGLGFLDMLPCPSNPLSWTGPFTRFDRDWVGDETQLNLFASPRDLASCTMITVADGATVEGPADVVIHRLIDESLQAVNRIAEITADPPYITVRRQTGIPSPRMILRPTDRTIWQEVADAALAAGVELTADLWWPGDPQPPGHILTRPTIVFTVSQEVHLAGFDQ